MAKNPCQYWSTIEPAICAHWDNSKTICLYKATNDQGTLVRATMAPYCNLLGTADYICKQYEPGEASSARCVLPDPSRHVTNKVTCEKWVHTVASGSGIADIDKPVYLYDSELNPITISGVSGYWSFKAINEYNDGQCDGYGTATTCSGYAPFIMAFGKLKPKEFGSEDTTPYALEGCYTKQQLGYRIPLPYLVFNVRAKLSKCYWWAAASENFSINTVNGEANEITTYCTCSDDNVKEFWEYKYDDSYGYIAPCNGAKPECPHYTGVCWRYCIDDKMGEGDKVLAEQLLELRYYIRRERWADLVVTTNSLGATIKQPIYYLSFDNPDLYAWLGTYTLFINPKVYSTSALIHAARNYFSHFDYFDVSYDSTTLTDGIPTETQETSFPTLIKEIKEPNLRPIIRNVFDQVTETISEGDEDTSPIVNKHNVFEVGDLNHEYLIIWGDSFSYNADIYAINLSDPDINKRLPSTVKVGLLEYVSSYAISKAKSADSYDAWKKQLNLIVDNLITFMPDSIAGNELPKNENSFYIRTKTFFGDNKILVMVKTEDSWEFDTVDFKKEYCGGIIAQTAFYIEGDGGTVAKLPNYESRFASNINDNGIIKFKFLSLRKDKVHGDVAYIYNDTNSDDITSFILYKVTAFADLTLTEENIKFFGNSGKALVILPDTDPNLNYIHSPFEIEGKLTLDVIDVDGKHKAVSMEIMDWCNDALEVNQFFIKPKEVFDFIRPCSFQLNIPKLCYYQKRSFNETPEGSFEKITAGALTDPLELNIANMNDGESIEYELSKFDATSILISAAYKSTGGRVKGATRTKPIMWVKQPYCQDVEIMYSWKASYTTYTLHPIGLCYGKRYSTILETGIMGGVAPPCGDHDLPTYARASFMWYPYSACDETMSYTEVSSAHISDRNIMEVFTDEESNHGSHDMRMLGPVESYGFEESHAQLWNCTCDFFYYNGKKTSENIFNGQSYYRGGLDDVALEFCLRNGGSPPKFGDVVRGQLNSYRTMDCVTYYDTSTGASVGAKRWMPIALHYTISDISLPADYYNIDLITDDYASPFIHQLGLLKMSSIDDVEISETVDDTNRFKFSTIFRANASPNAVYPKPRPQFFVTENLDPVCSWYTYYDYPMDETKSIQWVWQEKWAEVDRSETLRDDILSVEDLNINYSLPYESGHGRHVFINIEHPDYIFDYKKIEHQIVCSEGNHYITIVPSKNKDESDPADNYFLIQLDNGPPRVFDIDGNLIEDLPTTWIFFDTIEFVGYDSTYIKDSLDLYKICLETPWVTTATLFDSTTYVSTDEEALKNAAVADDRTYSLLDSYGDFVAYYYNRGLSISLISSMFYYLPKFTQALEAGAYNWAFNAPSLLPPYDSVEVGEYYPAQIAPDLLYNPNILNASIIDIDFIPANKSIYKNRFITRIEITYKFGIEVAEEEEDLDTFYHIPKITVYKSDESGFIQIYQENRQITTESSDVVGVKTLSYEISYSIEDMRRFYKNLKLEFDFNITEEELISSGLGDYYDLYNHRINIKSITLYDTSFITATEDFKTSERKYYVSYGDHADFPTYGNNSTGSVVHPPIEEMSTPMQTDTVFGILGVPNSEQEFVTMHKTSGRFLDKCVADRTRVPGNSVYAFEKEQKNIFDTAMRKGSESFSASSICPPGLKSILDVLNLKFPVWTCSFDNTLNYELTSVLAKNTYSPCGHEWNAFVTTPRIAYNCSTGSAFGRITVPDLFSWQYINPCTYESFGGYDWIESQYNAAINRFEYGAWSAVFSALSGGIWNPLVVEYTVGTASTVDEDSKTSQYVP
ncbi:MAG TPA: hypothetical protein VI911_07880 [Patescibacteria group bacterium]|nr:hypothetical protein [Patescibacteria group bacterium]